MINYSDALSDQLNKIFYQQQIETIWLLLDPILQPLDNLEPELSQYIESAPKSFLPLRHGEIAQTDCPYLISFNLSSAVDNYFLGLALHEAWQELHGEHLSSGKGRRICMLIATNNPVTLLTRWAKHSIQIRAHRKVWLRLHDPAVFWQLWPILDQAQHSQILESSEHVWLLDPRGTLTDYQSSSDQPISNKALNLTAQQWGKIDQIQQVNLVLQQIVDSILGLDMYDLDDTRLQLIQALDTALSLQFLDAVDQQLFMLHAIKHGASFYQHPDIALRIKNKQPHDYYQVLVHDFLNDDNELTNLPLALGNKKDQSWQ